MAENPQGYFPNFYFQPMPATARRHPVDVIEGESLRQQRRLIVVGTPSGRLRRWVGKVTLLDSYARAIFQQFTDAKHGGYGAFYFFSPARRRVINESLGSVTAASRLIIPYIADSISEIRVGGVTTSFTSRNLIPRPNVVTAQVALRMIASAATTVNVGTSSTLRATGDLTYTAWIWMVPSTANFAIMSNETVNASGCTFGVFNNSGAHTLLFGTSWASSATNVQSLVGIPTSQWVHVAVVKSGGVVTFYINGVAVGGGGAIHTHDTATAAFTLGAYPDATSPFDGMFSGTRVYNSALSAGEIANIANGNATPTANLKGHWSLNDGMTSFAASPIVDSSGYGNNGTLANSPVWVAGETEIVFASPQTGAVTGTLYGRERVTVVYQGDTVPEAFLPNAAEVTALVDAIFQEVY